MGRSRRGFPPPSGLRAATPSVSRFDPIGWRCLTPKAVVRCDRHSTKEVVVAEIALRAVSKRFGAIEAVRDLSLSIGHGEFVVLLGPTGAGKTTTLRLIAGLERPDRGDVLINGRVVTDLAPAARDVAFVFQQYSLY